MADIDALTRLIEPEAQALGFDLVRVQMFGGRTDPTLQVMAERPDTRQLDLADCEALSRRISDRLDALESEGRDPIDEAYRLEVSSPGIDRPLTRPKDFADWAGFDARIRLSAPLATDAGDRKQFDARLDGLEGDIVKVYAERVGEIAVPFGQIASAKLLLTDALIKATAPLSSAGAEEFIEDEFTEHAPTDGADRISQEG
jgi:ribosome maturation factor RimP